MYLRLGAKPEILKVLTEPQFIKPLQFVTGLWEKYLGAVEEWCLICLNAKKVLALVLQA